MHRVCALLSLTVFAGCVTTPEGDPARAFDSGLLTASALEYTLSAEDGLRIRTHFYNRETRGICIFNVSYAFTDLTDNEWTLLGEPNNPIDVSPGGICMPEMSDRIRDLHIPDTNLLRSLAQQQPNAEIGIVLVTIERDGKTFTRIRNLAIPARRVLQTFNAGETTQGN